MRTGNFRLVRLTAVALLLAGAGQLRAQPAAGPRLTSVSGMVQQADAKGIFIMAKSGTFAGQSVRIVPAGKTQFTTLYPLTLKDLKPGQPVEVRVTWRGGEVLTASNIRVLPSPVPPTLTGVFRQERGNRLPVTPDYLQVAQKRIASGQRTYETFYVVGTLASVEPQLVVNTLKGPNNIALPERREQLKIYQQVPGRLADIEPGLELQVQAMPARGALLALSIDILKQEPPPPELQSELTKTQQGMPQEKARAKRAAKRKGRHARKEKDLESEPVEAESKPRKREHRPVRSTAKSTTSKAERYFKLGLNLLKNRRIEKAKYYFEKAMKEDPSEEMKKKVQEALKGVDK